MTSPADDDAMARAAARRDRAIAFLAESAGAACDRCAGAVCGHAALMSYAAGHADAPLCLPCLGDEVGRAADAVRDELAGYILRKECLAEAWRVATAREGGTERATPVCLWPPPASDRA